MNRSPGNTERRSASGSLASRLTNTFLRPYLRSIENEDRSPMTFLTEEPQDTNARFPFTIISNCNETVTLGGKKQSPLRRRRGLRAHSLSVADPADAVLLLSRPQWDSGRVTRSPIKQNLEVETVKTLLLKTRSQERTDWRFLGRPIRQLLHPHSRESAAV